MACPCGCALPVKDGCTFASPQCWGRHRRLQSARGVCSTCAEPLGSHDVAVGCKRCKSCRSKSPRVYVRAEKRTKFKPQSTRTHRQGSGICINPKKLAPQKPSVSWWIDPEYVSDRAKFQARASQLQPMSSFAMATSASGDCV